MTRTARKSGAKAHDRWLRRQAAHVIVQLPEDQEDAAAILSYARELLTDFVGGADQTETARKPLQLVG